MSPLLLLLCALLKPTLASWEGETPDQAAAGPTKFFILATPRSGSTWLSLHLRNHGETAFHGNECWRSQDFVQFCASEWNKDAKVDPSMTLSHKLDALFVPNTTSTEGLGKDFVGFKWMANQNFKNELELQEIMQYINDNNVKVIALDRSNYLRKCFSFFDMEQRTRAGINAHHYAGSVKTATWDNKTHEIPADYLGHCLQWYEKLGKIMTRVLNSMKNPKNAILVKYEDMCGDTTGQLAKIQSFLGLKETINPDTNILKLHSAPVSELVNNYDQLRPRLLAGRYGNVLARWEDHEC